MDSKTAISGKRNASILSTHKYLRTVYCLSTAIGIFPFLLNSGHYIISYFIFILSVITVIFLGYSTIFVNYSLFYKLPIGEELVMSMEIVLISCVLSTHSILFVISAGSSCWRVRAIRRIIEALEEVDSMLGNHSGKEYNCQDFVCIVFNVLLIACQGYLYNTFTFRFFFIVITINIWLTTSQFSVLARLISNRLENACESLNDLRKTINLPYQQEKVAQLSEAHDRLCDVAQALQAAFGLLITVVTIINFMGLTVVTFYLYNSPNLPRIFEIQFSLSSAADRPPIEKVLWMIYILAISWIIAASSSRLTEKTKEFNQLLYQLITSDKTSQLMRNEKLLLHLSMKREVVLTACGLFNLDFSLIHSMVAAAATYLVMLIQFGQQD